jgi:capsid protein
MGERRNGYRILAGRRPLERPRRRWVDNIKMNLRKTGWDGMDWIDPTQDRNQWRALVRRSGLYRYSSIYAIAVLQESIAEGKVA